MQSPIFSAKAQNRIFLAVGGLFSAVFIFFVLYHANWWLCDDTYFLPTTAVGKLISLHQHISPGSLRFFPLGHYDYNILTFIPYGHTPLAHYIFNALYFLAFISLFCFFLKSVADFIAEKTNFRYSGLFALAMATVMVFSRMFPDLFFSVVYPERQLMLLFAAFMFFAWRAWNHDRAIDYWLALIAVFLASYCKEPVFGAFWVFAFICLIFNWRQMTVRRRWFCLGLVANGIVYLLLFFFMVYAQHTGGSYGDFYTESRFTVFKLLNGQHLILYCATGLGLWRAYAVLFRKQRDAIFFDALLFSGLAYMAAYVVLRLPSPYYVLPAVEMIVPAITFFAVSASRVWRYIPAALAAVLLTYYLSGLTILGVTMPGVVGFIQGINHYQFHRTTDYAQLEYLTEYCAAGGKILDYHTDSSVGADSVSVVIREFEKSIVNAALNFKLGMASSPQDHFQKVSTAADLHMYPGSVVFYSDYNNAPLPAELQDFITAENLRIIANLQHGNYYGHQELAPLQPGVYELSRMTAVQTYQHFSLSGFGVPEGRGQWTCSDDVNVGFRLNDNLPHTVKFILKSYAHDVTVAVAYNGREIGVYTGQDRPLSIETVITPPYDGIVKFTFAISGGTALRRGGKYLVRNVRFERIELR